MVLQRSSRHSKHKIQMKKYEDKAIPLIFRQEGKGKASGGEYEANPEALAFLKSIEGKIAIISVAGMYRTGKSYLLNTILLKQKGGFAVGPTTNPKTKGIWVWGRPLIFKNEKDEMINVVVMDSQGLGSTEEDVNHDLRLFSLTLLLSSMFIYNTMGSIDEHAIDSLGLVLRLCQHLRSQDYNDFPDFYWVLRDFSLALVGRDNKPVTTNKYLQNSLAAQPGPADEVRNRIRQSIRSSFINRTCYAFVRPVTNEEELQKLDTLDLDQLRPQFTQQVLDFRRMVSAAIKTKKIKGKEISSGLMVELIRVYLAEINSKKLPEIQTGWKYVCARECEGVLQMVERQAEEACGRLLDCLPTTRKELGERQQALLEQLTRLFDSRTLNNDQAEGFRAEIAKMLAKRIERVEEEMRVRNAQQTKAFIKKQFENIERRLKGGEFKSMGELVKEFELFYEYYRKKCPYKDQIQTGLQFLMKKFSDCSLLMFKNFKVRKDQQMLRIREESDKLASEFATKDQRQKHERTAAADKAAILQSRIEQLMKQNRQLADSLARVEAEFQRLKAESEEKANQAGEQIEYELILLRKKLMEAEDQFKEVDCKRILEVNNIKNSLVLKENELVHFQEAMGTQTTRANATIKELLAERDEKERRIEELAVIAERVKKENEKLKKTMEENIREKTVQISKLQQALELKSNELTAAFQRKETQIRQLKQSFDSEKVAIAQTYREQMRSIQDAQKSQLQQRSLKIRKAQSEMAQRESQLKMHRLQLDKQAAILNQKLQFLRQECLDKEERLSKLQGENSYYANIFEEKDTQISNLSSYLQDQRSQSDTTVQELNTRISELTQNIADRNKQVTRLEQNEERLKGQVKEREQELRYLSQKLKTTSKSYEEKLKEANERLSFEVESAEKSKQALETEIDLLRTQNSKSTEEQKRNIELSLVQLKNYYEMQRQRLEKKNLENRKKHQQSESNAITELQNKHRKAQRVLQEEIQQLRTAKDAIEQQITRLENDFEIKTMAAEEERQNERRMLVNRFELLEKKYCELQEQFQNYERSSQQERITFVKRIEGLNFELSRKQKQLLQSNSKRQSLEGSLKKKETQMEGVKRMMNTEIESSLKKVSDIQAKYQRLNEEYMQYKIESDKQIALCRQRNEFLNAKLQDITRQKESTSSKNIQRLDKQKMVDMKDQIQKTKAQLIALQTKNEGLRRTLKEQETVSLKRTATLEKQKEFLQQKQAINLAKISDLQAKVQQKSQLFAKDLDEARIKHNNQRECLQKESEELRERISALQDEKSQLSWTMQKDIALLNERIKYAQYQKEQIQKQREDSEKRLQNALQQIRKSNEKMAEDSQNKRNQSDKKYVGQLENLRETLRSKESEYEEQIRRQREEAKSLKDKNVQLQDKLNAIDKQRSNDKSYQDQIQALKREKDNLMTNYRNERARENDEWKRKNTQLDKKCKELQKKNFDSIFAMEKESSRWIMERDELMDKIKKLEDSLQWELNKSQLNKSKNELKRSESSNIFSSTATGAEFRSFTSNWKT